MSNYCALLLSLLCKHVFEISYDMSITHKRIELTC
jgi:hypothetical protein